MPNERLIRDTGGYIHLEPRWGWNRRPRSLTDDQVWRIRAGDKGTDYYFSILYEMTEGSIAAVRYRQRYRDVPDVPSGGE